jgi:hypothetical protein
VVLGDERARFVEGALHRAQVGETAQRRRPCELCRRILEHSEDLSPGVLDGDRPATEVHAEPAGGESREPSIAGRARVLHCERELSLRLVGG